VCGCNKYGSTRMDCDQEDGRCHCKAGVYGLKCDECLEDEELTKHGCISIHENRNQISNLCSTLNCDYQGSYCSVEKGVARCICDTINCINDNKRVCGEDGQTYSSECDLLKLSCAKQTHIGIVNYGNCVQGNLTFNLSFSSSSSSSSSYPPSPSSFFLFIVIFF
jgi:hypothetical protein